MQTTIKLTILAALGAAFLVAPASAKTSHWPPAHSFRYSPAPNLFRNDTVIEDGQVLGRDPDANVRAELRRDSSEYTGND
jgi:hypothetical protein